MALFRTDTLVMDAYGVDPLRDKVMSKLFEVSVYRDHVVTEEERGRPDLISHKYYHSPGLWWIILAYNKLIRHSYLKEGLVIRVPDISQLSSHLVTQTLKQRTRKVRF